MQLSGGQLLADGLTAATQLFLLLLKQKCKSSGTRRCCASEQPPEGRLLANRSPVTEKQGASKPLFLEFFSFLQKNLDIIPTATFILDVKKEAIA